ncbi:MAG: hypothetical protein AAF067_02245 [Pseudomonadota bacterium]
MVIGVFVTQFGRDEHTEEEAGNLATECEKACDKLALASVAEIV